MIHCDIAIIGGGAGGLSLAAGAAQLGAEVVLIESDQMGGDCLNSGCVPSKSLLSIAKAAASVEKMRPLGIHARIDRIDFSAVMQQVHQVISHLAVHDSEERFTGLGVQVIKAKATFIDKKTLQAGAERICAKRYVLATGSRPAIPEIPGIHDIDYLTNETVFALNKQPEHLIVIGGGPIGCELAQAFAFLGTKVTLLEKKQILPKDDIECADIIRQALISANITLYEETDISQVTSNDKQDIEISIVHQKKNITLSGSHVLVAAGRQPNTDALALEKAGVAYSARGITVDRRLRTTNHRIFAIGDVTGGFQFTHVAGYHAGIVLRNILFKWPAHVSYLAVPWVTYTYPEIAQVGLTVQQTSSVRDIQVIEWAFASNDRAQTEHETLGKIKVVVNRKGKILGVTLVGANAGELLLPWVMAIHEGKTLKSFTDIIVPYPTFSEATKRVAGQFYVPKLFNPKVKKVVRWLLRIG